MNNIDKFSNKAEVYSNYRPKYPGKLLDFLIDSTHLHKDSLAIDIGCGTGILTKQLLERNVKTIGVEPNVEMYNQAKKELQGYNCRLINTCAEDTQLPSHIADLITVAQALHWFDLDSFIKEYNRLLKENGQVAILYNNMDKDSAAVTDFLNIHRTLCPQYKGFSKGINNHKDIYTEMFGKDGFTTADFPNDQILTYEEYMGYASSLSYSLSPDDINYLKYRIALDKVFEMYSSLGRINLPTTATLVLSKKRKLQ